MDFRQKAFFKAGLFSGLFKLSFEFVNLKNMCYCTLTSGTRTNAFFAQLQHVGNHFDNYALVQQRQTSNTSVVVSVSVCLHRHCREWSMGFWEAI